MNPILGTGAWLTPATHSMLDILGSAQRGFYTFDHFDGEPPDNNKSGNASWFERVVGGGTSAAATTVFQASSMGNGLLRVPTRAEPVTPDAGSFRLSSSANELFAPDDLRGEVGTIFRIYVSVLPSVSDDYQIHMGVTAPVANELESTDGFYVWADRGSANWVLRHRRAGATRQVISGFALTPGAWQTLALIADVDANTVSMFGANDGDLIEQRAMLIPVNMQPAAGITSALTVVNPGNVTSQNCDALVDYVGFGARWSTPE